MRSVEAIPRWDNLVCLRDPQGFADRLVLLPPETLLVVSLFDGNRSTANIQAEFARRYGDILPSENVSHIVQQLDAALFLECERFLEASRQGMEAFRACSARPASHVDTA